MSRRYLLALLVFSLAIANAEILEAGIDSIYLRQGYSSVPDFHYEGPNYHLVWYKMGFYTYVIEKETLQMHNFTQQALDLGIGDYDLDSNNNLLVHWFAEDNVDCYTMLDVKVADDFSKFEVVKNYTSKYGSQDSNIDVELQTITFFHPAADHNDTLSYHVEIVDLQKKEFVYDILVPVQINDDFAFPMMITTENYVFYFGLTVLPDVIVNDFHSYELSTGKVNDLGVINSTREFNSAGSYSGDVALVNFEKTVYAFKLTEPGKITNLTVEGLIFQMNTTHFFFRNLEEQKMEVWTIDSDTLTFNQVGTFNWTQPGQFNFDTQSLIVGYDDFSVGTADPYTLQYFGSDPVYNLGGDGIMPDVAPLMGDNIVYEFGPDGVTARRDNQTFIEKFKLYVEDYYQAPHEDGVTYGYGKSTDPDFCYIVEANTATPENFKTYNLTSCPPENLSSEILALQKDSDGTLVVILQQVDDVYLVNQTGIFKFYSGSQPYTNFVAGLDIQKGAISLLITLGPRDFGVTQQIDFGYPSLSQTSSKTLAKVGTISKISEDYFLMSSLTILKKLQFSIYEIDSSSFVWQREVTMQQNLDYLEGVVVLGLNGDDTKNMVDRIVFMNSEQDIYEYEVASGQLNSFDFLKMEENQLIQGGKDRFSIITDNSCFSRTTLYEYNAQESKIIMTGFLQ